MTPVQHPTNNMVFTKPPGLTDEECAPLTVTRIEYLEGVPGIVSFWKPTPEELVLIAAGALVQLTVLGDGMPPVILEIEKEATMFKIPNTLM